MVNRMYNECQLSNNYINLESKEILLCSTNHITE